jgi:ABC-type spermidine/putrescine transport system permease subunit II
MTAISVERIARLTLLSLVGISLIFPTLIVIWLSFGIDPYLHFPPTLFSLNWYAALMTDDSWTESIGRTLIIGSISTVSATVAGTFVALALARTSIPGKAVIEGVVIAPLVVPTIVLAAGGYALFLDLRLVGSFGGIALVHAMLGLPYVYLVVSAALSHTDPNAELAALITGASRLRTILDITLPSILPSIGIGALFAFLVSFDEVVLTVFLSGALGSTIPVKTFSSLIMALSPVVAALSTLQVLAAILFLGGLGSLQRWQAKRIQQPNAQPSPMPALGDVAT